MAYQAEVDAEMERDLGGRGLGRPNAELPPGGGLGQPDAEVTHLLNRRHGGGPVEAQLHHREGEGPTSRPAISSSSQYEAPTSSIWWGVAAPAASACPST